MGREAAVVGEVMGAIGVGAPAAPEPLPGTRGVLGVAVGRGATGVSRGSGVSVGDALAPLPFCPSDEMLPLSVPVPVLPGELLPPESEPGVPEAVLPSGIGVLEPPPSTGTALSAPGVAMTSVAVLPVAALS